MNTEALLRWYRATRRDLPWRADPHPYKVWLSEIMAQQTRIETMLPYWQAFMARWPTVVDLAAASEQEVTEAWAGLGYYSRARALHRAAVQIAAQGFPQDRAGWQALPGIGPYTSAAICSIALGQDEATVDGNIERVLCRWYGIEGDPREPAVRRDLWARAQALMPAGGAGDWNQALMEHGALTCTPRKPDCADCTVRSGCASSEDPERLPNKPRKLKAPEVRGVCAAIWREGRLLMARRPPEGLLGGLWELPTAAVSEGEDGWQALGGLLAAMELSADRGRPLGAVRHIFSHRKLTQEVLVVEATGTPARGSYAAIDWLAPGDAAGLSTLARKTLALVLEDRSATQTSLFAAEPPTTKAQSPSTSDS